MIRINLSCLVFLFLLNTIHGQDVLLFEDFNTCTLPEKWSYTLTGFQNVVWGVGKPANPKAEGLSINGSCMLYFDDDLTGDKTPAFKVRVFSDYFNGAGYSDIQFNAQVHFRRDKTESMRIIIDNGKKEHIIRQFKGSNVTGAKFTDFLDVRSDLSFVASDSMRLIIEYEDDGIWGWWAGIDNIKITGTKGGNIILGETFNDCSLPQGWSHEIVNGAHNWQYGLFNDGKSIDGTCFVYFNDDALGKDAPLSKIRLYSPEFNAAEYAQYQLTYDFIFRIYEPSEYLQIYVDNGKEWIPVKTYNGDFGGPNINQSKKDTIDLSPYRGDKIRLIWEYNDGGWAWWLGFDNVKITGAGSINDRCAKALPLVAGNDCLAFDNTNALRDDEFDVGGKGNSGFLYYTFDAMESGSYAINTSSAFNDVLEIYSGTCTEQFFVKRADKDEYGFRGETIFHQAAAGEKVIIRIHGTVAEFGLDKGKGCISVTKKSDGVLPPDAEICQRAVPLPINEPCSPAQNIRANMDGPLPVTNLRSRADIWYSFIPSESGDYEFFSNADFSDAIAVYSGDCTSLVELTSNYEGQKVVITNAESGKTYYIQITGYFSALEGHVCASIRKKQNPEANHTNCIQAMTLNINSGCVEVNSAGSGYSGIRPECDAFAGDDVWFKFTAPASKEVYFRVKSEFENVTAVYSGSCSGLKSVYCNKKKNYCDGYIHLERLEAGKIYYIQVGSVIMNSKYRSGAVCVELFDQKPDRTSLKMMVTQECVSKGAVKFLPEVTGGNGIIIFDGPGIMEPVAGGEQYVIEARDSDDCIIATMIDAVTCNDFGCSLVAQLDKENTSCFGLTDGYATFDIQGGLEPYHIRWSNGQSGSQATDLAAGTYSVTATDESGCEMVETFTIFQPSEIITNPTYVAPLCHQDSTGSIALFTIGGYGAYTYHWNNGHTNNQIGNIPGGIYHVTITDETGCVVVQPLTLDAPAQVSISGVVKNIVCHLDNTGTILTDIKGGVGPYSALWSDGATGLSADSLAAGTYTVTITDSHQCTSTASWSITAPDPIEVVEDEIVKIFNSNQPAIIRITTTGGVPPYTYLWFKNGAQTDLETEDVFLTESGVYHVKVIDANGCNYQSISWEVQRSTNTENSPIKNIAIHPNPTRDYISLVPPFNVDHFDIKVKDVQGKIIQNVQPGIFKNNIIQLNLAGLNSGTYMLEVRINDAVETYKVVKID